MHYKSNKRQLMKILRREILEMLDFIGSTVSLSIMKEQQANIYAHPVPGKYSYTRTHMLSKYTGYKIKRIKGVVIIFSTRKYAPYLEALVGPRWKTHSQAVDLQTDLEKMKMPSRRPYSSFLPGFIKGMKKVKKKFRSIKWHF